MANRHNRTGPTHRRAAVGRHNRIYRRRDRARGRRTLWGIPVEFDERLRPGEFIVRG